MATHGLTSQDAVTWDRLLTRGLGMDALGGFASRGVRRRRVGLVLLASDAAMLLAATAAPSLLGFGGPRGVVSGESALSPQNAPVAIAMVCCLLAFMFSQRLYTLENLGWGSGEFSRVAQALGVGVSAVVVVSFLENSPALSREWVVLVWVIGAALVMCGRFLLRTVGARQMRRSGWLRRPTLIVGSNLEAAEITRIMASNPDCGLVPVGTLSSSLKDKLSFDYCEPAVPVLGAASDLVNVVVERAIDTVVIVASAFDYEIQQRMIRDLHGMDVGVHISSGLSGVMRSRVGVRAVSGVPLLSLSGVALSPVSLVTKRVFDLIVGGAIIVIGLPLWIVVAAMIKANSEGPVLFTQERVGRNGRPFLIYKFRTMVDGAERRLKDLGAANEADGPLFKIREDPRLTAVGKKLRKYSIDEFPQLINVMKGEMSLVGPRPPLKNETTQYSKDDWHRLDVPPGMTGLWQVSGRSNLTFREMVRLDTYYVDNWSVRLDLSLLVRTIPAVLLARGAC